MAECNSSAGPVAKRLKRPSIWQPEWMHYNMSTSKKGLGIFNFGCMCYLCALCAVAALKKFPISVDDLLIDIAYHFKYSAKRWTEYEQIQCEFSEIQPLKF